MASNLAYYEQLIQLIKTIDPNATFENDDHEEILQAIQTNYPDLYEVAVAKSSRDFSEGLLHGLAENHA